MKTKSDGLTANVPLSIKKYRYVCHGCTHDAGYFENPVLNAIVKCPKCGMEQHTKLENFIAMA